MTAQHTPGPWAFSKDNQLGDTRFYIAQEEGAPYTPNYSDVATLIAETVSGEYVFIQEANARLIAAAPELLAIAIHARNVLPNEHWADDTRRMLDAAIQKATKEQT